MFFSSISQRILTFSVDVGVVKIIGGFHQQLFRGRILLAWLTCSTPHSDLRVLFPHALTGQSDASRAMVATSMLRGAWSGLAGDDKKSPAEHEEAFLVRVDLCTTGTQTALLSLTCSLHVVSTLYSQPAVVNKGSTRTYNFCYPHKRGRPRKIGLSGDMLDLASQTPLGSEHTWRIRTKGSQRKFHYEIAVDRSARCAQLSVDGEKEDIIFPWVSLEDEDCELASKKANEGPERNGTSGRDDKQRSGQRRADAQEKFNHVIEGQDLLHLPKSNSSVQEECVHQKVNGEGIHGVSESARRKMAGMTANLSGIKSAFDKIRNTGEDLIKLIADAQDIQGPPWREIRSKIDEIIKAIPCEELYYDLDAVNSKQKGVSSIREFAGRLEQVQEKSDMLAREIRSNSFHRKTANSSKDVLYAELSNSVTKLKERVGQLAREVKKLEGFCEATDESVRCR